MWQGLVGSIRQIGVFMICAQALIHFKPKGSYEKYMKLLVSAMILVQLLSPVAALLSGGEGKGLEEGIAFYSSFFEQGLGEAAVQEYQVEQLRQTLLGDQIRAQLEAADLWPGGQGDSTAADEGVSQEQESTGDIRAIGIRIEPVTVEMFTDGWQDGEQEGSHGGEDEEADGEMAPEG